ncbi:MAG: type VI secretion system Vgr family protein, partial [Betaproteobacteria bacterium]
AISKTYRFEIILISDDPDVDFSGMLNNPATLTLMSTDQATEVPYHGILAEFEQLSKVKDFYLYRAVLVPKIWRTSLSRVNEVYLSEQSVPDLVQDLLKKRQLVPNTDFEMALAPALASPYTTRSFYCQFNETDFNFIARRLEHHGIYYFFKHDQPSGELLYMTDATLMHPAEVLELQYSAPEDVMTSNQDKCVIAFVGRQQPVPKEVIVQDFWQGDAKLDKDLKANETVSASGEGTVMFYGCNVRTTSEASHIAKMRAQEILCRSKTYVGESPAVGVRSGYFIKLKDHYRSSVNAKYLVTEVTHSGSQAEIVLAGQNTPYNNGQSGATYQCSFSAIEESMQFRAECVTPMPTISGTMSGIVEGSGSTPELNTIGEYKVKLLYDHSFKPMGGGAIWVRMASPFSGSKNGMFFGLRPGAEVLLSFAGGDPDQPVIISSAPNSENPSVVDASNATFSGIKDHNGNMIVMNSTPGDGAVGIVTNNFFDLKNDGLIPATVEGALGMKFGFTLGTKMDMGVALNSSVQVSTKSDMIFGVASDLTLGAKNSFVKGPKVEYVDGPVIKYEFSAISGKGKAGDIRNQDSYQVATGFGEKAEKSFAFLETQSRALLQLNAGVTLASVVLAQVWNGLRFGLGGVKFNKVQFQANWLDIALSVLPTLAITGATGRAWVKAASKKNPDFAKEMIPNSVFHMDKSIGMFMGARAAAPSPMAALENAVAQAAVKVMGGEPASPHLAVDTGSTRIRQASNWIEIGLSSKDRDWVSDAKGKRFLDFHYGFNGENTDDTLVRYTPTAISMRSPNISTQSANLSYTIGGSSITRVYDPDQNTISILSVDRQTASMDLETASAIVHRTDGVTLRHGAAAEFAEDDATVSLNAGSIGLKKGKAILTLNKDTIRITLSDATGITITPSTVNIGSELTVQGDTISNNITSLKKSVEANEKAVALQLKKQEDELKKLDDQMKADAKKYEELLKKRVQEN